MTTMPTFGLFSLMQQRHAARGNRSVFADLDDQVALAEDLGFETAWFAEHHFSGYSLCPSPLMAAAYFAGRTKNIRLGTGVIVLPLYDPIRVMEEIAMVDLMSDGRLIVGVGGGYQPFEFERFRLNLEDSAAMFMESLDIIEAGLTQEEFSYDGQHYKIPPTRIAAKPVQKPLPQIAVAGMLAHDAIKRRVARHGWIPFLGNGVGPYEALAKPRENYDALYREYGQDPARQQTALMSYFHCTEDRDLALDAAERARYSSRVSLSLRLDYGAYEEGPFMKDLPMPDDFTIEQVHDQTLIGHPDEIAEKIARAVAIARPTHIAFHNQPGDLPQERVLKSMELFGKKVLPQLQQALAA
jgi:alkanesulfonate monooxygenase SsuD/methylene tetrahydromethanopterin reductase-like flavin-dependent oxidoreductase (luciferase family)